MNKGKKRAIFTAMIACVLSSMDSNPSLACGPFSKWAEFSLKQHPDFPLQIYAAGQLGIIKPDYARSYLVVAYRYLSGIKTSPEKQKEIVALWQHRMSTTDTDLQKAVEQWTAERTKIKSAPLKDVNVYDANNFAYYVKYNAASFTMATETLKSKISKYGVDDSRVKDWVLAQDFVFGVSSDPFKEDKADTTSSSAPDADPESRADRNYQIACKRFYEDKYDDAIEKFLAIAKDTTSPWRVWGNYLAARAYCRRGTLGDTPVVADLNKAKSLLDEIIQSNDQSKLHQSAKNLNHFIEYRLDPENRAKQVIAALLSEGDKSNFTEDLGDYTIILDKIVTKKEEAKEQPTSFLNNNGNTEPPGTTGNANVLKSQINGSDQPGSSSDLPSTNRTNAIASDSGKDSFYSAAALIALTFFGTHLMWWRPKGKGTGVSRFTTISVILSLSVFSCAIASCAQQSTTSTTTTSSTSTPVSPVNQASPTPRLAADLVLNDELTTWLNNFQDVTPEATDKAFSEWKNSKSLPWLVSVISHIKGTDTRKDEVLAAAGEVPGDSPAYFTIAYHRIRLLKEAGKTKESASSLLALLKEANDKLPPSSRNLLFILGVGIVDSLPEFTKMAAPSPALECMEYEEIPEPADDIEKAIRTGKFLTYPGCLTAQAANIINEAAPLSTLVTLSQDSTLPAPVRLDIAQAAWVRSVLLKDEKTAMILSPVLSKLRPQLAKAISAYDAASTGAEKEFAALSAILHNPAMRPYVTSGLERETAFDKIDNYRDNWWCAAPPTINHGHETDYDVKKAEPPAVAFLTEAEKKKGIKEFSDIKAMGTAPNMIAQRVLNFTKAKPQDPRNPEVLHLVVTSTRYGCTDETTTPFSKQAFQELHKKYPGNPWTAKTKFWF
ncbi:MAG: hypothetical protein SGJ27_17355 [Candidatus Melainabacteria bacterium]|nr:hypothetical protein [Candidatus Melainabacteria bacterium]